MTATAGLISVEVPDIGDYTDVPVIEIHVAVGDAVAVDDPLVTLESDKATMDVPAPAAGVVKQIAVKLEDRVSQGSVLMTLTPSASDPAANDGATPAPPEPVAPPPEPVASPLEPSAPPPEPVAPVPQPVAAAANGPAYASPSVRRVARERGIDLAAVVGTGRKGRITKTDVQGFVDSRPATASPAGPVSGLAISPWPSLDFEKYGPIERVERTRIQKISAPNLARNWVMIPHVTQNDEADITELEAWRKRLNGEQSEVKVTMVAFLIVACVATLKEFPTFNSSLDGDELVLKRYYNLGFAADTPGGLVVPVIKGADHKGVLEIAGELTALSGKAREGKLMPGDMAGSTFTISSLGGIGGTSFTPIINAPEVAILGVSRAAMKPVWNGSEFVPRLMVPLSLSYDHRVIDGAAAARFVVHLAGVLSDLRRALL